MRILVRKAFEYRALTVLLLALLVGLAWQAVKYMPSSLLPEVMFPKMNVIVSYKDSNLKDIDTLIAQPLERSLMRAPGVRYVRATVWSSAVRLKVAFEDDLPLDDARRIVEKQVDEALDILPKDCPKPVIQIDSHNYQNICDIRVSGPVTGNLLLREARDLQKALEGVNGIYTVEMLSHAKEEACIEFDPMRMMRMGLTPEAILDNMSKNSVQFPGTVLRMEENVMYFHTDGRIRKPEDIIRMPVATSNYQTVYMSDIATVYMRTAQWRSRFRYGAKDAIVISVLKRPNCDALLILKNIGEVISNFNAKKNRLVPAKAEKIWDVGPLIKARLDALYNTLALAVLFVVLLVGLSLQARSVLLVGLAIPVTFIISLAILGALDYSLNIVILFGLIGAVGVLVDGAIIVNEHADHLMCRENKSPLQAYGASAQKMAWPAFTSILTIILSFLPLLFWPGGMGKHMRYLPMTFIVTLSVSVFCALIFMPVIGASLPKIGKKNRDPVWTFAGVMKQYHKWLVLSLNNTKKTMSIIVASVVFVVVLFGTYSRGIEFFPSIEPYRAYLHVLASDALSFQKKLDHMDTVEKQLSENPYLRNVVTFVGNDPGNQSLIGHVHFGFVDWRKRPSAEKILAEVRSTMQAHSGVYYNIQAVRQVPNQGWDFEISVEGHNKDELEDFARNLQVYLRQFEGLKDLKSNLPPRQFHWKVDLDRDAILRYGISARTVRSYLSLMGSGLYLGPYLPDDLDLFVDVVGVFPEKFCRWDYLRTFLIHTKEGMAPLGRFFNISPEVHHTTFMRCQGKYSYDITANLAPDVFLADMKPMMDEWISKNKPNSVTTEWHGADAECDQTAMFLVGAFLTSMLLITMILLVQFNSVFQVFVVLSAVWFSTLGALLGLVVMGQNFCVVMTGIGIVALSGIIVSNNVILLDTYNSLLEKGHEHYQALIEAAVSRIRPICLTQITTVLGLIPMMLKTDIQLLNMTVEMGDPAALWWVHLATAIVWGVSFATPFTLFATPLFLHLRHRYKKPAKQRAKTAA
ncbi:MAG: efflux RND transporter permease subunit [Alphaproteobacteria bacterium]|nr:efflux RND transporter permease subunit [Alphaproteobacteria bacterium]